MTKSEILMALLNAPVGSRTAAPILGTTRLQKLLFLVEKEAGVIADRGDGFDFTPYKFGPVSKGVYDDLTKLENLGYLASETVSEPSFVERDEYGLSFEGLMDDEDSTAAFDERRYGLTSQGREWLKRSGIGSSDSDKIAKVKGKYGSLSLSDLLHYVYTRYPDMTTASEIKDRVLGF